jgi:hypothetical protein
MSKNKNKNKDKDVSAEGAATTTKAPRKARAPLGPLPERLCEKADKIHAAVSDMAQQLVKRGAPQSAREAALAFVAQVEAWREIFFTLKSSGWEPVAASAKVAIVEGDPIQIVAEHVARYSFIEGLAEGKVQLVAGSVVQTSKLLVEIMLKDTEGKFYGYAPRRFLAHR